MVDHIEHSVKKDVCLMLVYIYLRRFRQYYVSTSYPSIL